MSALAGRPGDPTPAVTVLGTNLVIDYGSHEAAVAAMDRLWSDALDAAGLEEGITMRGHAPGACWCGEAHVDEPSDGTIRRKA